MLDFTVVKAVLRPPPQQSKIADIIYLLILYFYIIKSHWRHLVASGSNNKHYKMAFKYKWIDSKSKVIHDIIKIVMLEPFIYTFCFG